MNPLTHPQIHIDYYNWLGSLSADEKKFFQGYDFTMAHAVAMWAFSRSREIIKDKVTLLADNPKVVIRLYTNGQVAEAKTNISQDTKVVLCYDDEHFQAESVGVPYSTEITNTDSPAPNKEDYARNRVCPACEDR